MRPALLAVPLCLLAASAAAGQGPGSPAPTGTAPPAARSPAPLLTTNLDPATGPGTTAGTYAGYQNGPAIPPDPGSDGTSPLYGPRAWGSVEYLLWFVTPMNSPDLIQ